ncbi:MAG TPA: HPr(Ser) kinase/phosphatase [Candidatus Krumholzibacteria bacterium]|nr:HPr(Ser) kinase/phosphatase [Candidatus Krumholzibacteria bacterium]HPD71291.1 HPr(Ser) kinase/phosphatase [Candidatus Krumholzibacteria bacterium]HRY39009.1 HPr(Ser) kinase/phosphatase [Candidatus Krumholzibacteria bacterium]
MTQPTVQQLYQDLQDLLGLEALTPLPEAPIPLVARDVHRPGMAVMGFMENFLSDRVQVMGESEMSYLASLDAAGQLEAFGRVLSLQPPTIVVTRGLPVPDAVLTLVRERGFPLLRSARSAEMVTRELNRHLERAFAPSGEVHGTLVDVYGVGLLFTGRSGIGKSECALDLVERGHRLVADDIVEVMRTSENVLIGRFRALLQHNIEIRGVGVIDVQAIFGIHAIRMQKRIEVAVELQDWDDQIDYERVGMERRTIEILGVEIPQVILPLNPGKNITVISEVIALDFMLKIYGYDAARILNERIIKSIRHSRRLKRYLEQDLE